MLEMQPPRDNQADAYTAAALRGRGAPGWVIEAVAAAFASGYIRGRSDQRHGTESEAERLPHGGTFSWRCHRCGLMATDRQTAREHQAECARQ